MPGTLQVDTGKVSSMRRKQMPGRGVQAEGTTQAKVQGWKIQTDVSGEHQRVCFGWNKGCKKGRSAGYVWAKSLGPDNGGPQIGGGGNWTSFYRQ